jgi:hypothetical protein
MTARSHSPKCPECGSLAVRRSHRTWFERILTTFDIRPLRCSQCRHRFLHRSAGERKESARRRLAVRKREAALYVCALFAFAIFAWIITIDRG